MSVFLARIWRGESRGGIFLGGPWVVEREVLAGSLEGDVGGVFADMVEWALDQRSG